MKIASSGLMSGQSVFGRWNAACSHCSMAVMWATRRKYLSEETKTMAPHLGGFLMEAESSG